MSFPHLSVDLINEPALQENLIFLKNNMFSIPICLPLTSVSERWYHKAPLHFERQQVTNHAMCYTWFLLQSILPGFPAVYIHVFCVYCQQVEATRHMTLEELPPVLVLHLKYFLYDKSGGCQKLNKNIEYGVDLEISKGKVPVLWLALILYREEPYWCWLPCNCIDFKLRLIFGYLSQWTLFY